MTKETSTQKSENDIGQESGESVASVGATDLPTILFNADSKRSKDELADARTAVSSIADAKRPWEQLPSDLKSAARADAKRLLGKSGDVEDLTEAGYSRAVANRLMADLGLV